MLVIRNQNITIIINTRKKMVDLHTHILPNIDDGAASVEEAQKMAEMLVMHHITSAVCTPHYNPTETSLQSFINARNAAISLMSEVKINLIPASETILHEYLFHYSELNKLCIENTRYLLLELPYYKKWDEKVFVNLERIIIFYNITPIIAHIERYQAIKKHKKYIRSLLEMGCLFQINASSVLNKKCRKKVLSYIKHGYIDVIASDCHNMTDRLPILSEAYDMISDLLGEQSLNQLIQNAECIINDRELREKAIFLIKS